MTVKAQANFPKVLINEDFPQEIVWGTLIATEASPLKLRKLDMAEWLHTLKNVQAQLPDDPTNFRFHYALRHGSMKFGLYAPRGEDTQGPHKQDELYIIVSGNGTFIKNGERRPFHQHDALFVEAGADHRFADFSEDFSTWVIFWGPDGGEQT